MKQVKVRKKRTSQRRTHSNNKARIKRARQRACDRWSALFFAVATIAPVLYFLGNFTKASAIRDPLIVEEHSVIVYSQYLLFLGVLFLVGLITVRWIRRSLRAPIDQYFPVLAFIILTAYYILAFQHQLSPNGDNAEYIINAKSLVEHGQALRLNTPHNTPNSLASLGLPLLLAPIYHLWGVDIFKMKCLILALALCLFPAYYSLLRHHLNRPKALLIAMVSLTSPYLVASSSVIMTEIPYMLAAILGLIASIKFCEGEGLNWKWGVATLLAALVVFQMRIIGIGLLLAIFLHLTIRCFRRVQRDGWKDLWHQEEAKKLLLMAAPSFSALLLLQLWQGHVGTSQASVLFQSDLISSSISNFRGSLAMLGPMLFSPDAFRWASFAMGAQPPSLQVWWLIPCIPLFYGWIKSLKANHLVAVFTLTTLVAIWVGSRTAQEMVLLRYMLVLIPFLLYFLIDGTHQLIIRLWPKSLRKSLGRWPQIMLGLLCLHLVLANADGNSYTIARAHVGFGPRYDDMMLAADWANDHLPRDAYVASAKPRIFYLFAERKGMRILSGKLKDPETPDETILNHWFSHGVTHIMVDKLSTSVREIVMPLIDRHQNNFQKIPIANSNGSATIYKLHD
ncbi:MAG: hypothetical protein KTR24_15585 [Saprospiraceae bacterium]|nr:hypothetical protein [Saprospiraceae bacterium]